MPVQCTIPIQPLSLSEFSSLDYQVMKHAFACQNAIGSLADERVYQADFAARLIRSGFQVDREVEVILSHKAFRKSLFLDHVIQRQAVYELKVAKSLTDAHRSQLLTYLYLLDLERGKLINFATPKVQTVFVNAAIPTDERHNFSLDHCSYNGPEFLMQMVIELVRDWGTSLSISLYLEAVTYLLGGSIGVEVLIPMCRDGIQLGNQRFYLASPDEAFYITAITKPNTGFQSHLERLLSFSPLTQLHWINISRHQLQLVTLRNQAPKGKPVQLP